MAELHSKVKADGGPDTISRLLCFNNHKPTDTKRIVDASVSDKPGHKAAPAEI
jgi:hypothetical protein